MTFREQLRERSIRLALLLATVYGVLARLSASTKMLDGVMGVMTFAFIFIVPVVIGYIAVRPAEKPTIAFRIFAPWIPCFLIVLVAAALGWEGAICIAMALPVMLVLSSFGGCIAGMEAGRRPAMTMPFVLALPYIFGTLEHRRAVPLRLTVTRTETEIAAPPSAVWPLVASVDSIRPEEEHPALFTSIGFPHPVSAVLDRPGVGGVRKASFTGGLLFTETVTDWQPGRRLSFTIRPNTSSIPPTTLDPHVRIGGKYFDVLSGTYVLEPIANGHTRLVLLSEHRVSTPFNFYAGWWADRVMHSIQSNILEVIRERAERTQRAG